MRGLLLAAGAVAALLLVRQGEGQALAPLAIGVTLGALCMGRFGTSADSD